MGLRDTPMIARLPKRVVFSYIMAPMTLVVGAYFLRILLKNMEVSIVKKRFIILLTFIMVFASMPVLAAAEEPVIYKDTITVTEDGGRYQIGFVEVEFKKDFLGKGMEPVTFDVEIYAENGLPYIEFSPDAEDFTKKVHIRVDSYEGLLYDKALGENIEVDIQKQQIVTDHFSRYCFWR